MNNNDYNRLTSILDNKVKIKELTQTKYELIEEKNKRDCIKLRDEIENLEPRVKQILDIFRKIHEMGDNIPQKQFVFNNPHYNVEVAPKITDQGLFIGLIGVSVGGNFIIHMDENSNFRQQADAYRFFIDSLPYLEDKFVEVIYGKYKEFENAPIVETQKEIDDLSNELEGEI